VQNSPIERDRTDGVARNGSLNGQVRLGSTLSPGDGTLDIETRELALMKSKLKSIWIPGFLALTLSSSLGAAQPPNSSIQYLRPADLSRTSSFMPGSAHGHVRQKLGYGKGYRYGHGVNSPLGDIIIWSASPNHTHGTRVMNPGIQPRPRAAKSMAPQLRYKPAYGKTTKPGYGD